MRSRWMRSSLKLACTRASSRRLHPRTCRESAELDSAVANRATDDSRRRRKPPFGLLSARGEPERATKGSEEGLPPLRNPSARKDSDDSSLAGTRNAKSLDAFLPAASTCRVHPREWILRMRTAPWMILQEDASRLCACFLREGNHAPARQTASSTRERNEKCAVAGCVPL